MRLWSRANAILRFIMSAVGLPGVESRFFMSAWWTLLVSQVGLRLGPARSGHLLQRAWECEVAGPWRGDLAEARLLELFERAAGDHVLGITCLGRSLALKQLLDRRQIGSRLCLGVRRSAGRFETHAWIERNGRALTGGVELASSFLPFDRAES